MAKPGSGRVKRFYCSVFLALGYSVAVRAQEGRGYAEVRVSWFDGVLGSRWQLIERIRPTLETEVSERIKIVATVDAALAQGRDLDTELARTLRDSELSPQLSAADCLWHVPENRIHRIDLVEDYLRVDRLYLDLYAGVVDIRVGRQALNWGTAQFLSPNDPFPELLLAEPWRPRKGINAARVSLRLGDVSDLTGVVATNDALTETWAAGRMRLNLFSLDFTFVGAWRGEDRNALAGIGIRGTLELGFWIEAAYLFGVDRHEEIAVGVDYSFPVFESATLFVQYYRNGAGASGQQSYPSNADLSGLELPYCRVPFPFALPVTPDPFAPFTAAKNYLVAGATLQICLDLSISASLLHNLDDTTGMVVPTVTYSALDWLDFAVSAQLPYAAVYASGEFKPSAVSQTLFVPLPDGSLGTVDLSGLLPDTTVTAWTRASF